MLIQIKARHTDKILYSGEHESIKDAVVAGVKVRVDLSWADLRGCDLSGAYLVGADLRGCYLNGVNLYGASLSGAKLDPLAIARLSICPEGDIVGWKKIREGICKLLIPSTAKRSNATGRKCRAEFAVVLELPEGCTEGRSLRSPGFIYRVGETVRPREPFCEDRWQECASGIHFYITREEAESHSI